MEESPLARYLTPPGASLRALSVSVSPLYSVPIKNKIRKLRHRIRQHTRLEVRLDAEY